MASPKAREITHAKGKKNGPTTPMLEHFFNKQLGLEMERRDRAVITDEAQMYRMNDARKYHRLDKMFRMTFKTTCQAPVHITDAYIDLDQLGTAQAGKNIARILHQARAGHEDGTIACQQKTGRRAAARYIVQSIHLFHRNFAHASIAVLDNNSGTLMFIDALAPSRLGRGKTHAHRWLHEFYGAIPKRVTLWNKRYKLAEMEELFLTPSFQDQMTHKLYSCSRMCKTFSYMLLHAMLRYDYPHIADLKRAILNMKQYAGIATKYAQEFVFFDLEGGAIPMLNPPHRPLDSLCECFVMEGHRCTRPHCDGDVFCWQHRQMLRAPSSLYKNCGTGRAAASLQGKSVSSQGDRVQASRIQPQGHAQKNTEGGEMWFY